MSNQPASTADLQNLNDQTFGTATGPPLVAVPNCERLWRNSEPFLCVTQQNLGTRTKNWFPKVHM